MFSNHKENKVQRLDDINRQNLVNGEKNLNDIQTLASELQKEKTKQTLAKLYEKVLDYGSELAIRCSNCKIVSSVKDEDIIIMEDNPSRLFNKSHPSRLKENAQFLIDSSRKIPNYDPEAIKAMESAFLNDNFHTVMLIAANHDINKRPRHEHRNEDNDTGSYSDYYENTSEIITRILEDIIAERKDKEPSALQCCVEALKLLDGELNDETKKRIKELIMRATILLENDDND